MIDIPEDELVERFVTASGPGGQNVNKVATAVELRFDVRATAQLSGAVKARLAALAGRSLTNDGVLVIFAQRFRSQERNRADARERLAELIARASVAPVRRRPTRPTLGSKTRRLESKQKRGAVKRGRSGGRGDEE